MKGVKILMIIRGCGPALWGTALPFYNHGNIHLIPAATRCVPPVLMVCMLVLSVNIHLCLHDSPLFSECLSL